MPYTPITNTSINVILSNDLSGTLDNPYVISVENIKNGVLGVINGGVGTSSFPAGQILLGNGSNPLYTISGNQDDILTWSEISSSWVTKHIDIVEDITVSSDQNSIFEIRDQSVLKNKSFNISFLTHSSNKFLASPSNSSGFLETREISQEDLPRFYDNIFISNSTFNGNFSGSGQFTNISGDGSQLINLSSSQILDFDDKVTQLFSQKPHFFESASISSAYIDSLFVEQLLYATGTFYGTFVGDGESIQNIDVNNITDFYEILYDSFIGTDGINFVSGVISAPGLSINITASDSNVGIDKIGQTYYLSLKDEVTISLLETNTVSASNIFTNNLNISNLSASVVQAGVVNSENIYANNYFGNLIGTYSGSGQNITNIPTSSLEYSFIMINGEKIGLGQSFNYAGIDEVQTLTPDNLSINTSGTVLHLSLSANQVLNDVYANKVLTQFISSSEFVGDGRYLTNLTFNDVNSASINNLVSDQIICSTIQAGEITVGDTYSSRFFGDGSNITNINVDNVTGLNFKLDRSVVGSGSVSVVNTPDAQVIISLKNDITLNSITSSFDGDGSRITNIQSPLVKIFNNTNSQIGDIVYILSNNTVAKASNINKATTNAIGIVTNIIQNFAYVQLDGECYINNLINSQTAGTIMYLGTSGDAVLYENILPGQYAYQIGTISNNNSIIINFKKLWKVK